MKTFFNLVQEVQKPGLCYRCGGCVTFCTAVNYGALGIDADGKPVYQDMEKCIECGLCYSICPEINDLDEETKRQAAWSEPMGRVIETTVVRSSDPEIRKRASDGGAVTALLAHLFDRNRIDGAIVTRPAGRFQRQPFLATSREEILGSAGFSIDTSHGIEQYSEEYLTFSTIREMDSLLKRGLKRVAFVGTPCQIKSLRKMQVLNLVPSESISLCLGLFCSGNFVFGEKEQQMLAAEAKISSWDEVERINIKGELILTLKNSEKISISLEKMEQMKRYACSYCPDYSAEFSDISFGGIGAEEGWTTLITRTPLGRAVLADIRSFERIEQFDVRVNPEFASQALQKVRKFSSEKKKRSRYRRRELQGKSIIVQI